MKFINSTHKYISDTGEQYLSVTKLIKMLHPDKDWDEIAKKYAKKNKLDIDFVKEKWAEESRKSIEKGVKYHNKMEDYYVSMGQKRLPDGNYYPVFHSPIVDDIKSARNLKLEDGIYPELIIFSNKYKVAGQADLVEVYDGKINITDYKTSKKIDKESYKHPRFGYEMYKTPVGHLMNCNFNDYCLQINIYMLMLKAHNPKLKIGDMVINHVKIDDFDEETTIIHKVPNMQKEAKAVLEYKLKLIDGA